MRASRVLVVILLSLSFAHAQEAKERPWHPGQTITLNIAFTGPDASTIKQIYPRLQLVGQPRQDQTGFISNIGAAAGPCPTTTIGFHCEFPINEHNASGEYNLYIDARGEGIQLNYTAGQQFQFHTFHIENSKTFTVPGVVVKEP